MIEGQLFKKLDNNRVLCLLCAHYCKIAPEHTGKCRVRKNIEGELYSLNSDKIIAVSADPIEKKPLYHFLPASTSYSIAAMGCNFNCDFCQNSSIAIVSDISNKVSGENLSAKEIISGALSYNATSIAYTYTEPTVFFELVEDVSNLAKQNGLKNIMVTNGYMSDEAIERLVLNIDAVNIDIKAFSNDFYKNFCSGSLQPVLNAVKKFKQAGVHIELTTLLIDDLNDNLKEITKLIEFILETDENIPWHISRFYPTYNLKNKPPTNIENIYKFVELGYEIGLQYIYSGNIQNNKYSNTICPKCKSKLIERNGYATKIINLKSGKCSVCNKPIKGIWK